MTHPTENKRKKRCYIAECGEGIVAFVASNAKVARRMAHSHDNFMDIPWIKLSVSWKKDVDVSTLPFGEVGKEGLELGIYYCFYDSECLGCKDKFTTILWDEKVKEPRCSNCHSEGKSEYDLL